MNRLLIFNRTYFVITVFLFLVEVFIALYVNDSFIRPYGGDFLVVILIYCFLKSFLKINDLPAAISVLVFAYTIEILQHFHLVDRLGLSEYKLARVVIGNSFQWFDLVAYTLGIGVVILAEKLLR